MRVNDGDDIEVEIDGSLHTVRYTGIDAPDVARSDRPAEPLGPEAAAKNEELVGGQVVELEKDVSGTDKYGRLLRYVWIGDVMVNAEMVRLGWARARAYPPDVKYEALFLQLQEEAKGAGWGIWGPAQSPGETSVVISFVFYDGLVPKVESDEYAEILNQGSKPVNVAGWRLNAGSPDQDFIFPDFVLQPGQACRVYTNEVHTETCGFSFNRTEAIWRNSGDCGYLYDAASTLISSHCY